MWQPAKLSHKNENLTRRNHNQGSCSLKLCHSIKSNWKKIIQSKLLHSHLFTISRNNLDHNKIWGKLHFLSTGVMVIAVLYILDTDHGLFGIVMPLVSTTVGSKIIWALVIIFAISLWFYCKFLSSSYAFYKQYKD